MSGRLDQSLDSIIDSQKKAKRDAGRRTRKPGKRAGTITAAPVGGVKKAIKQVKNAGIKGANSGPSAAPRESKIVVSGLPFDVNETQIKEYFQKSVGQVKKVSIQYNQSGVSRGIADIRFAKPGAAAKAAKDLNGMLVDKRPMKIEVVVDAGSIPEPAPTKSLSERMAANPKAQPKSATATKVTAKDGTRGRSAGKPGKPKRGKNLGRPKAKTAAELDAEMTDYFGGNNAAGGTATTTEAQPAAANGAPATTGDDMGMEEIS